MSTYISEEEKLKHPYYKLMELKGQDLEIELNSWSRLELQEFGNTVSKEEAIEIITRQITEA